MGCQDEGLLDKDKIIKWCLLRQTTGFAGRPNKKPDTCYCFWIGAALKTLGVGDLINSSQCREFLMTTQTKIGGFGKDAESFPDVMHSYMGIAALSLMEEPGICAIDSTLNAPVTVIERLKSKSVFWKTK
ncbi:Geranylgeranyl transferase type-1 subunit beta [Apophysomyces sp. BC1015]|nr:Geranylgeranyl transferase type-1 subunit beta [Apophysomyces sp. BC1015]